METNIYRCTTPCDSCPFIDPLKLHITETKMRHIKKGLDEGGSFNCHKTAYPDVFEHEDIGLKMCYGAYEYLRKKAKPNQVMQVAERMGYEY